MCVTCFNKHDAAPERTLCSERQLLFTGIEDILYRIRTDQPQYSKALTVGVNDICWETLDPGARVVVAEGFVVFEFGSFFFQSATQKQVRLHFANVLTHVASITIQSFPTIFLTKWNVSGKHNTLVVIISHNK